MSLPFKTTPMFKEYFKYQLDMCNKYGDNTVVFMEVGSFFEIYEIELEYNIGKAKEISNILNIQVTKKNGNNPHGVRNPFMMGFPTHSLDKFVSKLIDNNYTIITVIQYDTSIDGTKLRKVDKIYSPSTYTENITTLSNYLVCVYIEKYKSNIYAYLSAIDFNTGESKLYTTFDTISEKNKCENDIFRFIHSLNPREIIFNKTDNITTRDDIVNKYKLNSKLVHIRELDKEYKKLSYQNQFLKKIFTNTKGLKPIEYIELSQHPDLVISFIFLLQFSYEHDHTIINKIKKPYIIYDDNHLILNNDSIYQLNIIDNNNNKKQTKYSSLFNLVNMTVTNMGKRLLKHRLLYPITNIQTLEKRYKNIDNMKNTYTTYSEILSNISDIEKYQRRVYMKKLDPHDFYMIDTSYKNIIKLLDISEPFFNVKKSIPLFTKFYNEYNNIFNLENMRDIKLCSIITQCIFKKGVHKDIDNISDKINVLKIELDNICKMYLSKNTYRLKVVKGQDGYYIHSNVKTGKVLQKEFPDIHLKSLKSYSRITSDRIDNISCELCELEHNLSIITKDTYIISLYKLYSKYRQVLQRIIDIVSELDFVCSAVKVSNKYCYSRPIIKNNKKSTSFVDIKDIRHPIIEQIIDSEYIVNNINNTEKNGILLYGVNASGKSSIIRALGCNIILAQAGLFVASKSFTYFPYKLLLSKISCTDNLFKGQSTFISEALEIKNMVQRSDNRTLVLADELCAGTEGLSATSLVGSTILQLVKNKSSFMFSTHLHSLMDIECIKECDKLSIKHFSIEVKNGDVVYNRILKDGNGDSVYGLEIANTLDIGTEFMKDAFKFRSILEKKTNNILSTKTSRYNNELYIHECSICKKQEDSVGHLHTHHIHFQKNANKCGIIKNKHFHKNSIHNLIVLCGKCHRDVHKGELKL